MPSVRNVFRRRVTFFIGSLRMLSRLPGLIFGPAMRLTARR
jgi:hypothetical protein